jgi:transposase-like protein
MPEVDVIELGLNRHFIQCPHCQKQAILRWPGIMILFSNFKCTHCGRDFVIALNQPRG